MGLRIALVDVPANGWRGRSGLFDGAVEALSADGHDVRMFNIDLVTHRAGDCPILTGLGRERGARPMINSHRLAVTLMAEAHDMIIAPLRGGAAQACLMARACAEAFADTRIAVVANEPSRARYLAGDTEVADLSPIVADAMERQCMSFADAVIFPGAQTNPAYLIELCERPPPGVSRPLAKALAATASDIQEIVFIGAFQRSSGAGEFVEAIERLSREGIIGNRRVTFLGPATESQLGLGKDWLGMKARDWPFPFRMMDEIDTKQAFDYASRNGRLVVAVSPEDHELNPIRVCNRHHIACVGRPMQDPHLAERLAASIASALQGAPFNDTCHHIDWPKAVADLVSLPLCHRQILSTTISVCILHHNRLPLLAEAIASIPARICDVVPEIVIIDNASPIPDIERKIRQVTKERADVRVLALATPSSPTAAYNQGLAVARGDIVAFLDDDNLFLPDGLSRLATALATGGHDIVVSSLDMFDENAGAVGASFGRMIFLGAAYSAGLFFNAFGDTSMAVRREAFTSHGGFHDLGYYYPRFDWVTLAKAQSAGLRIGALQAPAVRYRHRATRLAANPAKLDEAGALALVFDTYQGKFDAKLVARFAQQAKLVDV